MSEVQIWESDITSNKSILRDGLMIISTCKKDTGDIWQAHFGAAAIGSYFFVTSNNLSQEMAELINSQAESMVKKILGTNSIQHLSTCDEQTAVDTILEALDKTIDQLHWVGHNVIYSAASLVAIHELNGWGSTEDIAGITDLILSFQRTIPGRSWIGFSASEVKRMEVTAEDGFPDISNPKELSSFVLEQLAEFPVIYRAESHHDLIGHMFTFSHALNILFDLGHVSFFKRGLPPLMKLIKVLRNSHNVRQGDSIKLVSPVDQLPLQPAARTMVLPTDIKFWEKNYSEQDWEYGHIFKFPHSFYDHLLRVDHKKESYIENFRYIIG